MKFKLYRFESKRKTDSGFVRGKRIQRVKTFTEVLEWSVSSVFGPSVVTKWRSGEGGDMGLHLQDRSSILVTEIQV